MEQAYGRVDIVGSRNAGQAIDQPLRGGSFGETSCSAYSCSHEVRVQSAEAKHAVLAIDNDLRLGSSVCNSSETNRRSTQRAWTPQLDEYKAYGYLLDRP